MQEEYKVREKKIEDFESILRKNEFEYSEKIRRLTEEISSRDQRLSETDGRLRVIKKYEEEINRKNLKI